MEDMAAMHELEKHAASSSSDGDMKENDEPEKASLRQNEQQEIPARLQLGALACVLFFTLGSNWAEFILGPLKSTIRKELNVTNAQWGVIASASNLVNSVMPIIAGLAVDYYGPNTISILSSISNLVGAVVAAVGASRGSFQTLVAGQIIGGFGNMAIETAQSKLYTRWFADSRYLAFIYGLDIAIGRVINVTANATSVPIMQAGGSWTWTFWVTAIMCGITLGLNIIYCLISKRMPPPSEKARPAKEDDQKLPLSRQLSQSLWIPLGSISAAFWLLLMTQTLQGGAVGTYMNLAPDVISQTRGSTKAIAGYTSAIGQILPIVLSPLVGALVDLYGYRMHYVTATGVIYVLVYVLLQFTQVHPLVPLIVSSFSLSFNALPFLASIPLLVPDQKLFGTCFGLWYSFQQAGQVITDIAAGAIQDATPGGSYRLVFVFLIAIKGLDVFFGLSYITMDKLKLGGVLQMSSRERVEREAKDPNVFDTPLKHARRWATRSGQGLLGCLIIVAWVIYLLYAQR